MPEVGSIKDVRRERRRAVRQKCTVLIETVIRFSQGFSNNWVEDSTQVKGCLIDLRVDGAKLYTKRQFPDGQELRLTLLLPGEPKVVAKANVQATKLIEEKGGYASSTRFVDISMDGRGSIERFLRSVVAA